MKQKLENQKSGKHQCIRREVHLNINGNIGRVCHRAAPPRQTGYRN